MAAFKRMLQVGMKAENCLFRYRALKAHLTSSSFSSKELLEKIRSHPEHEAADFHDDWERRMAEFRKDDGI
ncbi:hypothetical protein NL676_014691 [Syzygium grande]|nr:hypothetical protein NL676_014691 [Syzygium grande]